jgi:hypothetical protein
MSTPLQFRMMSQVDDIAIFETQAFGRSFSDAERRAIYGEVSKQLGKARSPKDKICRHFELAVINTALGKRGDAYTEIGAALEAATKGSSQDMFGAFTLCWPFTSYLVRTSTGSDPWGPMVLKIYIELLSKCRQQSRDPAMKEIANIAMGAFGVMHALELARSFPSEEYRAEYIQSATHQSQAIDADTENAFDLSRWVRLRLRDLGLHDSEAGPPLGAPETLK